MRRTNWLMKVLIVIPVLLFLILAIWVGADLLRFGHRYADETAVTAAAANTAAEGTFAAGTSTAPLKVDTADQTETGGNNSAAEADNAQTAQTDTADPADEDPVVHLLFAGDVCLSSHVLSAYDHAGGIHGVLDDGYRAEIGQADIFMANEEFPFSSRGTPADKQYTYRLPPERVTMMNEMGIDIVSLANNHTLDYGADALADTSAALDAAGILYVGAGENLARARQLETITVRGRTIGFLAASRVYPDVSWAAGVSSAGMLSGYDPSILLKEIEKAEELCDYLVVYVHWGIERNETPEEYQRALGQRLIDAGADIVIGSHPHVLQGVEYYQGKPIVYSLGNFVFGSSIPRTALLKADIDLEQMSVSLAFLPGTSSAGYTRQLADQAERAEFFQHMTDISVGVSVDDNGTVHAD